MKATDLLQKQHRLVEKLFAKFDKADAKQQAEIFDEIAHNLVAHDAIEREIFYPACAEVLKDSDDVLPEAIIEHGLVEFCLYLADKHRRGERFAVYVDVLKEMVEHHVKEEEKELLPKVKRAMDGKRLDELGDAMELRFAKSVVANYRPPLINALRRVLNRGGARPSLVAKKKKVQARAATKRKSSVRRAA